MRERLEPLLLATAMVGLDETAARRRRSRARAWRAHPPDPPPARAPPRALRRLRDGTSARAPERKGSPMTTLAPTATRRSDQSLFADLYIDGAWRPGSDGRRFPVVDPSDGSTITEFAIASDADCDAAIAAAEAAFPAWAATAPRERSEILRRAYEILTDEVEIFAEIMVRENGKAWPDAMGEAAYAKEFFRWFAEEAVRIPGDYRLSPAGDKRIVVTHQPIGVSLLITPWNFPAAMATRKLAPALAAGCTMILKPARETPLTAAYMVDVPERSGVPRGVVNLVTPVPT